MLPRQELTYQGAYEGRATHTATYPDFEANFAAGILNKLQADIVPANGRSIFCATGDGDLELARQKCKLRMQGAPLAQNFCIGTRIDRFINGHTCQLVGRDVANAIATGLNAVHVDSGQKVHHVSRFVQRNPVELNVLACREMSVAFD